MNHRTRRQFLQASAAVAVGAVAGCSTLTGSDQVDDLAFDRLQQIAVHVDDAVDLAVPAEVQTVSEPHNADLVVVPADTDVTAEVAVNWLADERAIALVGEDAEPTWFTWAKSDPFAETFDREGLADGDPDPTLLVAAAIDLDVTTYRHTWGDGPRDRDVLRALDEAMADVESRRSD